MPESFTAAERAALARSLAEGGDPDCPACGTRLSQRPVPVSKQVSYVRRRVWLLCPGCTRTGAVDIREDPLRGDGPP